MQASSPPNKTRCRLQFSLRSLFVVVTLIAVPCGWLGWQAKIVNERKQMLHHIMSVDRGMITVGVHPGESVNPIPWARRLFGDEPIHLIELPLDSDREDRLAIRAKFPEAFILGYKAPLGKEYKLFKFPEQPEVKD